VQSPTPAPGPTLQIPDVALRPAWADRGSLAQARADLYSQWLVRDPKLVEAAAALENAEAGKAKRIASKFLAKHPRSADALNIMGEIAARAHNVRDAERFLMQCVQCAPDHPAYRYNFVVALMEGDKLQGALAECEILLAKNPDNPLFRCLKAHLLARTRKYADASDLFRELTVACPDSAEVWMGLANALRSLGGHADEVVSCLRTVTGFDPACGSAWWALASMKTVRFTDDDARIMEEQLAKSGIGPAENLRALGITPVAGLPGVGANLQDHPVAMTCYATAAPIPASWSGVSRSPSTTWAKIGPGLKWNSRRPSASVRTWVPTMSEGIRSGVNWMRLKLSPRASLAVLHIKVLPSPGTPSIKTWPPANSAVRVLRTTS